MIKIFINKISFILVFLGLYFFGFSQSPIPPLQKALSKANSNKEKADISYEISKKYIDLLKVDSAIFFANQIQELSIAGNYQHGLGKYNLATSTALYLRRNYGEAEHHIRKAIDLFTQEKNFLFLGLAYRQLANGYGLINNNFLSRKNYWTAIHYSSLSSDENTLSREYFELGRSYYETFEVDSAAIYLAKSLTIAEKIYDKNKIYISAGYLGMVLLMLDDLHGARKYFEYAFENSLPGSNKVGYRMRLVNYASCLSLLEEFRKADSTIKEIEVLNATLKDDWGEASVKALKGEIEMKKKNFQKAISFFLQAWKLQAGLESDFDKKNILFHLGETEYELHRYDSAIVHLQLARKYARMLKFSIDEMLLNSLISRSYEAIHQPDSALHYFKEYAFLRNEIFTAQKQKNIVEITTRYETGKKEQEIKILQKEGEANSYLLRLQNQQIEKQQLEDEKKSQQMDLISKQNEINKLDASQKTLSLDNEKKENEKNQAKMNSLEKESALQTTIARNQKLRKNFAYGLIASILIFSGYGYYRYRQNKKLSHQLSHSLAELKQAQTQLIKFEKEKESENIRVRISRDIHDEVGATLSGVALFSEIAKQKMEQHNEPDAKIYLDHISANSKDMVEKMGDIVWTINPENDSIERIVARLKAYAVNLCGGKGIQIHFQVDEAIKDFFPDMPERKNIYLFSKEAINNAVKYSNGSNIFFSILKINDKVTLEIKDDGIGFDMNSIVKGNGLINMQARAAELNAVLDVSSKQGNGTCIKLHINFHPIGGQKELV